MALRSLHFTRRSDVQCTDVDELFAAANLDKEEAETLMRLARSGNLLRPRGSRQSLDGLFDVLQMNNIRPFPVRASLTFANIVKEFIFVPYTLILENRLDEPVQYVWAYELDTGLILVDESTYTEPLAAAILKTDPLLAPCGLMKQYAISVWDRHDQEIGRIPTLTVDYINQVEIKNGTYRACRDVIEIG